MSAEIYSEPDPESVQRVTIRSVGVGLFVVISVNTWPIYGLYVVHINQMVFSYMAMALMIPSVLLSLGVNVALRRFQPSWALSSLEMVVVFSMGLVGALFPLMNFTGLIMGHMATPYYFASPENRWAEMLHPHLPVWLFPRDVDNAMRFFFEGLPQDRPIPWDIWIAPLFWWFAFAGAITGTSLCIAVMLRKQWAETERLPFPAVQVTLEMVKESENSVWPPLARNPAFWIGLGIPIFVISWNCIGYFLPDLPTIPITRAGGGVTYLHISRYIPDRYFYIGINFFIMGFAYWTSLEVLFSIWIFYFLVCLAVGLFSRFGFSIGAPGLWSSAHAANAWQAFGALTFMLFWGLWIGRGHLKAVWNSIVSEPGARGLIDDSEELFTYRTAAIGLASGILFIVGWLFASGMELHVILPFLFGMFVLYVGVARVIAETGLVYLRGSVMPPSFALFTVGSASIRSSTMVTFANSFAYFTDAKSLAMASSTHISWLAAAVRGSKKPFAGALAIAGVSAAVVSVVFTLYLGYEHGAYNFRAFEFRTHPNIFNYYVRQMETGLPPDWKRLGFYGVGLVIMALLTIARYHFPWWPIHPIGFAIMETFAVRGTIFTIFIVWLAKSLIFKIGGIALYRKGQPFFLGILAGFVIGVAISAIVDVTWFPGEGHSVHHW
jgi:hypothetical protein